MPPRRTVACSAGHEGCAVGDTTDLARELLGLWSELLTYGAKVTQVPLDSAPEVLRAHIAHDRRRLRAIAEREAS